MGQVQEFKKKTAASKFSLLNSHATNGGDVVLPALIEAAGVMTDTKVKGKLQKAQLFM